MVFSKVEVTNFNANIPNNNNFNFFQYKAKLSGNTEGDRVNKILKNATIDAPLKYISNFWRSLEILLIN